MKRFASLVAISCLLLSTPVLAQYDSGRSPISIVVNNEIYPYREFATYVLPAEHLDICIIAEGASGMEVQAATGELDKVGGCRWIWTAPDRSGLTRLTISDEGTQLMQLNIFVMTPADSLVNGAIEGYRIGDYPPPLDDSPVYLPPDGFIRVTRDMLGVNLSPNFKLGQFVEQQDGRYPKYVVLRERLLLKLEAFLEYLNEVEISAESLSVVRGYITPVVNQRLGGMRDSRHIYGGAATFIVDNDNDGRMDDIDRNGTLNRADGVALFDLADELFYRPGKEYLKGGLYLYDDASLNTTLLMMDARGFRKRWENDSDVPELPESLRPKHKRQFE